MTLGQTLSIALVQQKARKPFTESTQGTNGALRSKGASNGLFSQRFAPTYPRLVAGTRWNKAAAGPVGSLILGVACIRYGTFVRFAC
jgi:hypothetical protein